MLSYKVLLTATLASLSLASPFADPDPFADADPLAWADANPHAEAAAEAYAQALAEAMALAHPDPEAYALAASADDCATIGCHAACGYLILDGSACSENKTDTYSGPYNTTCLCSSDSHFLQRYPGCMECGWTLWKYYGPYVTSALEACSTLSTEPTGTLRCSTTLSESYSKDANAGCAFGGACVSSSTAAAGVSNATVTGVSNSSSNDTALSSGGSSGSNVASSTGGGGSSGASSTGGSSGSSSSGSSGSSGSSASASTGGSSSATNGAQALVAGTSIFGGLLLALLI